MADRVDYAFPFRIDRASHEGARTGYEAHVAQMIYQVLLTDPGERADLPEFGCGLRALVFAGNSDALQATTQMLVQQALGRWLSSHVTVQRVAVSSSDDDSTIMVRVDYTLLSTRVAQSLELQVA